MFMFSYLLCVMAVNPPPLSESEGMCGTYALYVGLNSLDANLAGLVARP